MQHVLEIVQRTEMLVCPFLALVFMVLLAFKSWQVTLWERNSCFASHAQNIFWLARPIVSTHVLHTAASACWFLVGGGVASTGFFVCGV
jgi:hypothetical protein